MRLIRTASGCWIETDRDAAPSLVRDFAYAGGALEPCVPDPPDERSGAVIAIGRSLRPTSNTTSDSVTIMPVTTAAATRELLRPRWLALPPASQARERARRILHGEDAQFAWERRAALSRAAFADTRVRATFRPVVLDRAALTESRRGGLAFASDGLLSRWLFA